MVGGGPGAMIGAAHRHAMWLDNQYVLAAGIFGRNPQASAEFAEGLGVERVYADYREMAEREASRDDGVKLVAVVTPNDTHFEIAKAFLEKGISVVCEKPLTNDSATAAELVAIAASN
jgi:predicted dehydrogenase